MPPNLIVKDSFVRNDFQDVGKPGYAREDTIRTDFVLRNIFSYALRKAYKFDAICAINGQEVYVLKELKDTYDAFLSSYGDTIKGLCCEIEVTEDTLGTVLVGVTNELFSEGITWGRIIALFAFIGELTVQCLSRKYPISFIDRIYECFCRLVTEKLKSWVDDHGGWEGLTTLSVTQRNTNLLEPSKSNSSWALSFFHKTVQVIGTLAHIGNSIGNSFP